MKFEFTIEKPDKNGNLTFLDMNIKVSSCRETNCEWYKKPTDAGVVLNFLICVPIHCKKNIVEENIQHIFRSNST